jgi:hypothetical protein
LQSILEQLTKFRRNEDVESRTAFFRTLVPWVAPKAYLNIVFKPCLEIHESSKRKFPEGFLEFLRFQNGAILFSGTLAIYGFVKPGTLLERGDIFSRLPFDVEDVNAQVPTRHREKFFAFARYGYDGTLACIACETGKVALFCGDKCLPNSWQSLDDWLTSEINRLSFLFDTSGRMLANKSDTLPGSQLVQ